MRFLLLLPRNAVRLANFTVPAFEGLYALCPLDLSPRASGGEQKEKGNYTRSVCIHIPSISPLHNKSQPHVFLLAIHASPQQHLSMLCSQAMLLPSAT